VKVTYTSGSTAAPKGVCLGATDLEAVAQSLAGATSALGVERHLCLLPLANSARERRRDLRAAARRGARDAAWCGRPLA